MTRVFQMWEIIRLGYRRLAVAETTQKSILSERRKFLTDDAQEPGKCLHPKKCSARTSYTPKNPRSKAKARARRDDPADLGTAFHPPLQLPGLPEHPCNLSC